MLMRLDLLRIETNPLAKIVALAPRVPILDVLGQASPERECQAPLGHDFAGGL